MHLCIPPTKLVGGILDLASLNTLQFPIDAPEFRSQWWSKRCDILARCVRFVIHVLVTSADVECSFNLAGVFLNIAGWAPSGLFRSVGGSGGGALVIQPPSHPAAQPTSHLATILCWALHFACSQDHMTMMMCPKQKNFHRNIFVQHNNFVLRIFFQHNNFCVEKFCGQIFCVQKVCVEVFRIVCLELHVKLSMGGRGVILHFKRGHTT